MEFDYSRIPLYKLVLHVLQILFSFTAWCLGIAVFRAEGSVVNGQNGWTFGVTFLSIPAWIYLIGAPRFPRSRKLATPAAMAVVDGVYIVIWLSAFATQAAYNTANSCGSACNLSKAVVAMAFFVCIFFGGTFALSILSFRYYQEHHTLPGYNNFEMGSHPQNIDPDKAAFNPSMGPGHDEEYAPVGMNDNDHRPDSPSRPTYDPYAYSDNNQHDRFETNTAYGGSNTGSNTAYGGSSTVQGDPYGRTGSVPPVNPFDDEQSDYRPQTNPSPQGGRVYAPPAATDEYEGPAKFPAANYDRGLR